MDALIILAYSGWALYSGYKAVSGRWEWLDRNEPLSIIAKVVVGYVVGIVIGAYELFILLLKFIGVMSRM